MLLKEAAKISKMGGSGNPGKSDVTFRQAKEEKPFSCVKHTEEQLLKVKMSQKRLSLLMNLIRALNDKFLCLELEPVFFCLEPTQFGRSRSRLRDLRLPEPLKIVSAPQHWYPDTGSWLL